MYSGKASGSLFTDVKGGGEKKKEPMTSRMFNQLRSVSSIIQRNMVVYVCRRKAFASPNKPCIYHHSIISSALTSKSKQ